jgi:hypothetical protein
VDTDVCEEEAATIVFADSDRAAAEEGGDAKASTRLYRELACVLADWMEAASFICTKLCEDIYLKV